MNLSEWEINAYRRTIEVKIPKELVIETINGNEDAAERIIDTVTERARLAREKLAERIDTLGYETERKEQWGNVLLK